MSRDKLLALVERCGSIAAAARELNIPRETLRDKLRYARDVGELTIHEAPSEDEPIEDLLERRIKAFQRRRLHEDGRKLIPVTIHDDKAIGIWHMGDPHVDDDGTDIELLQRHARLVAKTDGLYAANVGDTTNNWVGQLGALYAQQGTSAAEAWRLAEWLIRETRDWLYVIGGNHDLWSGSGDPLQWITRGVNATYAPSEIRIALRYKNGPEVRVNCRHDFAGSSVYNPAHGPMKALQFGVRDHIAIAGHRHESAYGVLKDPDSGITMHAIKVASYKTFDRYARERGFADRTLSPGCMTVIDPTLPTEHPDVVKVFWDAEEGADFLTWKRSRA